MDKNYDYGWRCKPRTSAGKKFAVVFLILWAIMIFFPWNVFGSELVGWMPVWFIALLVVQVIYLIVWGIFLRKIGKGDFM